MKYELQLVPKFYNIFYWATYVHVKLTRLKKPRANGERLSLPHVANIQFIAKFLFQGQIV